MAWFLVFVMLRSALDTGCFATLVRIWIGNNQSRIQPYLSIQPSVSMGWISLMILLEEHDITDERTGPVSRMGQAFSPVVVTASADPHCPAKVLH
jgi:hypothetical protein